MAWKFNPFTNKLDKTADLSETIAFDDLSDMPGGDISVGEITTSSIGNHRIVFDNDGVLDGEARLTWDDATDTLTAWIIETTQLTVTGWTPGWCLYSGAGDVLTGEAGYTYDADTNTLYVDNIVANNSTTEATYLRLDTANDPLTNGLVITPYFAPSPASTHEFALRANHNIIMKSGYKLVFDGA